MASRRIRLGSVLAALMFTGGAFVAHAQDLEYGAYLSSECVTCHRADASGSIPVLVGRNQEDIVAALSAFKSGARPSAVMQQIASRLADDEMAALAAYFSSLSVSTECAAATQEKPC